MTPVDERRVCAPLKKFATRTRGATRLSKDVADKIREIAKMRSRDYRRVRMKMERARARGRDFSALAVRIVSHRIAYAE